MVRAVRASVFYETSSDPIRYSLLALDLITRGTPNASDAKDEGPAGDDRDGEGVGGAGGGGQGVAGQDRWFFTFLLCRLLSG